MAFALLNKQKDVKHHPAANVLKDGTVKRVRVQFLAQTTAPTTVSVPMLLAIAKMGTKVMRAKIGQHAPCMRAKHVVSMASVTVAFVNVTLVTKVPRATKSLHVPTVATAIIKGDVSMVRACVDLVGTVMIVLGPRQGCAKMVAVVMASVKKRLRNVTAIQVGLVSRVPIR